MNFVIVSQFLLFPAVMMFKQSEYTLNFERVEVASFDPTYLNSIKTHNFKYNRTYTAVNITLEFNEAFGSKLQVQVQAYRFASNEYRLFPLRFMFDFCGAAQRNDFGFQRFFECGNLTGCPLQAGIYRTCNWAPDASRFPPHVPKGSYMIDLIFTYDSVELCTLQGYGTVHYPLV